MDPMDRLATLRTSAAVGALLTALVLPAASGAQGLDGYQVTGTSTLPVLDDAEGYGGGFSAPLASWLWVRVAISTRQVFSSFDGRACDEVLCTDGVPLELDTDFDELALSLMPSLTLLDRLRLSVGPTLAVGQIRADVTAPEGFRPRVFVPGSGHPGYGVTAEVVLRPLRIIPLAFKAGWSWRRFDLDGCAAPANQESRPFCADAELSEFRLGGALMLGGS